MQTRSAILWSAGAFLLIVMIYQVTYSLQALYYSFYWPQEISLDASLMRYYGWNLLAGRWPWVDFETLNLPLTHYINALGILIFGTGDAGLRIMDALLVTGIACGSLYALWQHSRLAAGLAFILGLNLTLIATPLGAFQREALMILLLLPALALLETRSSSSKKNGRRYFQAGLLLGATVFIKPTGLVFILLALSYFGFFYPNRSAYILDFGRPVFAAMASIALLLVLPLLFSGSLWAFFRNYPDYFYNWSQFQPTVPILDLALGLVTFNPLNIALPLSGGVSSPLDTGHISLLALLLMALAFWLQSQKLLRLSPTALILIIGGFVHYLSQRKGFAYHTYFIWTGLELILAQVLGALFMAIGRQGRTSIFYHKPNLGRWLSLAALILLGCILVVRQHQARTLMSAWLKPDPPALRLGSTLSELNTQYELQGQSVQNLEIHSLAIPSFLRFQQPLATRYPMDHVLWGTDSYTSQARIECMSALQKNKAALLVVNTSEKYFGKQWSERLLSFPELRQLINREYVLVRQLTEINQMQYAIYIRRRR
ncbi:MAG: hypothetical protein KDK39_15440 [Leptospiraceae bacterium]|nr:hypothetical protein [Leptospiraceae bacterium]